MYPLTRTSDLSCKSLGVNIQTGINHMGDGHLNSNEGAESVNFTIFPNTDILVIILPVKPRDDRIKNKSSQKK